MGHFVDGFDLKFTGRTSWKAERRDRGKVIDVVPVTWVHSQRRGDGNIMQGVHYQDSAEMERVRQSREPFIVALAIAKDPKADPKAFHEFRGIFEVVATGEKLGDHTIETRVLRRVKAGEGI